MDYLKTPIRNKKHLGAVTIPPSPLMRKIGFGTGIAVYEMQRSPLSDRSRSPWAIKKLTQRHKKEETSKFIDERLQAEAEVLRKLDHPNIIGFRAFVKDSDGTSALAMEECTNCLGEMIVNRVDHLGEVPYEAEIVLKVAHDISKALDYLHNEVLLLHCDIKSFNVLVKGDFTICKLCDFGVCLPLTKGGVIDLEKAGDEAEYVGTPCWSAPEVINFPQVITVKTDIYAFGLVIWEMIALSPPIDDELLDGFNNSLDSEKSFEIPKSISVRRRPPLPDVELGTKYNLVLELYFCCTAENKDERPNARDLVGLFEEMLESEQKCL